MRNLLILFTIHLFFSNYVVSGFFSTGLSAIDLEKNSFFHPAEINIGEEYRLSMLKFQPIYIRFRKEQLLANQSYILSVSYPGFYATRFHIYWVDFEENFVPSYFNPENPRFRPKDEDKHVFLTDEQRNVVDKNAFIFVDYEGVEYYHVILYMWFWMHGTEMEKLNQPLDFALTLKPSLHPMNYQHEINLYISGSIIVLIIVTLFLRKKLLNIKVVREILSVTFTPDSVSKDL